MDVGSVKLPCGCDTRKETIGTSQWWTGVVIAGAVLIVCLTKGGNMTKQTKNLIGIASAGAVMAILADKIVNPKLKG